MPEPIGWTTLPDLTNETYVRAPHLQAIWDNTDLILNPLVETNAGIGAGPVVVNITSASFVDVHATLARVTWESTGRQALFTCNLATRCSASDTAGYITLVLDGVNLGDATYGLVRTDYNATANFSVGLVWPIAAQTPGQHTIKLQAKRAAGTGNVAFTLTEGHYWWSIIEW